MRVVASEFVSLDGIMEDPGGAETFEYGGWSNRYWSDDLLKVVDRQLRESDGMLLGRRTYEGFAAAWPTQTEDEGFTRMTNLPKYVVSSTLNAAEWTNSRVVKGDLAMEITKLKREPGNMLVVLGSASLVQELTRKGLMDEYRLIVYPVTLGTGKRLFDGAHAALELVEQQAISNGVMLLTYRPAAETTR